MLGSCVGSTSSAESQMTAAVIKDRHVCQLSIV